MRFDETTLARCAVYAAGAGLFAVAYANFLAPGMLRYRENLAQASRIVRQIFYVHGAYIVAILIGQGLLCFAFPEELGGATPLGRALAAFLAVFWLSRFWLQGWYYDRAIKAEHPRYALLFLLAFLMLGLTFATLALRAPFRGLPV